MEAYQSPSLVEYGLSKDLVKGACGWGTEGVFFNRTGSIGRYNVLDCDEDGYCIWVKTDCFDKEPTFPCQEAGNGQRC
ncbi:hypothetical protein MUB24_13625 [Lederbergia sp. NSJ-179]|uniref:hypothetical protein n=1 Tax=Lederbergia sp. NSJ-179 TaxID=2931402 RepID=UPI001FD5099E|nr:hypothetical protein [Lederbergia sp. NSJ-179]MCJ7841919.1 hypothetical protein [Lederbergia sp. NSJ-179]